MKELPLLLNGPMVRAVRDGRKTQTRRPARRQYGPSWKPVKMFEDWSDNTWGVEAGGMSQIIKSPFGAPGDLLWVRETFLYHPRGEGYVQYRADDSVCVNSPHGGMHSVPQIGGYDLPGWRPSIHMPRWASRLTLRVLRVWVERVQDISRRDAYAEGIYGVMEQRTNCIAPGVSGKYPTPTRAFHALWDSIYAARGLGWDDNPLVWACEFEVVKR